MTMYNNSIVIPIRHLTSPLCSFEKLLFPGAPLHRKPEILLTPKGMGGNLILMLLAIIPAGCSLYSPMYTYAAPTATAHALHYIYHIDIPCCYAAEKERERGPLQPRQSKLRLRTMRPISSESVFRGLHISTG